MRVHVRSQDMRLSLHMNECYTHKLSMLFPSCENVSVGGSAE